MNRVVLCAMVACVAAGCSSESGGVRIVSPAHATDRDQNQAKSTLVTAEGTSSDGSETQTQANQRAAVLASTTPQRWIHAAGSSEYVLAGPGEQFVGVWVDVPRAATRFRAPAAVTLTIDTSGSMAGEKIRRARQAARLVLNELHDGDLVTVHTFSSEAFELIAPTRLSPLTRQSLSQAISELSADGATNMHQALQLAMRRTRQAPDSHPVRRIVMISDGRATAGPTSPGALASVVEQGVEQGIQVTALGVGLDYDEDTLNALAIRSSGRLYHLSDPSEMVSIIAGELRLLDRTMATRAALEIIPAPGVQLLGASGRWSFRRRDLHVPLGTMFAGQHREVVVRYRLTDAASIGDRPLLSARLHFQDPADGGLSRVQEVVVRGRLTNEPAQVHAHRNPAIESILALQGAARMTTAARQQVAAGSFDNAAIQLSQAETRLRKGAATARAPRARKRLLAAADRLARSQKAVRAVRKAPPAGRAKAARASALELNDASMEAQGY